MIRSTFATALSSEAFVFLPGSSASSSWLCCLDSLSLARLSSLVCFKGGSSFFASSLGSRFCFPFVGGLELLCAPALPLLVDRVATISNCGRARAEIRRQAGLQGCNWSFNHSSSTGASLTLYTQYADSLHLQRAILKPVFSIISSSDAPMPSQSQRVYLHSRFKLI